MHFNILYRGVNMNKTQKSKQNWRNSKAWKAFRHQMNVLQHCIDPITGSKLAKGAHLHHRHVTANTEEYTDISNTDDYVMLNCMTHKMLHFIYTYYKKYGRAVLDRIEEELNRWY